jgi:hypothetical protein
MSYRIDVPPEAGSLLRSFSPHVVMRLAHALADLADLLASGGEAGSNELTVEDCVLRYDVDHREQLVRVLSVEQLSAAACAPA